MDPLVLIVDDNEKNLKLARDVLQAAGFRTLEAETGAEGVALAAEHVPDVILMDLRLPDMDGADAARALRASHKRRTSPSSRSARYGSRASSRPPFAGYIEKPIAIATFPEEVRRYAGC